MATVAREQPRTAEGSPILVVGAILLLCNAILLAAFPYFCSLALGMGMPGGVGLYDACVLAATPPLFPLGFLLAALDAALAVALLAGRARRKRAALRRGLLARAALGALAWGALAFFSQGNPYAIAEFALSALLLLLFGGLVLRLLFPGAFWLIVFFTVPLMIVFVYSFLSRPTYGGVEWTFTWQNYADFFNPNLGYLSAFLRSVYIAAATTLICFLFGYPLAYYIARRPPRWRNALLLLLMIPFWTNFVVRTYAWEMILSNEGLINTFWTGPFHSLFLWLEQNVGGPFAPVAQFTAQPLPLLYNEFAVIVGLVYGWITDMTLPCYAAIERLDFGLVEAAKDLYASDLRAFARVVLPLSMPGIVAGSILVFIPSLGAYITPVILGGGKTAMIGTLITEQFLTWRNWPMGSAMSFLLMAVMLAGALIYFRTSRKR